MEGSQYILACQKDSYLTGLKAKVLSCKEEGGRYEVVLNDTVIFPEGGGQPCDLGSIDETGGGNVSRN